MRFLPSIFSSRPRSSFARSPRRGSVIVLVLVLIFLTALLLTRFIETASVELLLETRHADRERLRQDARSAMEVTLATLADFMTIDHGLYTPVQGWQDPLGYAGYAPRAGVTVDVAFEDESGKIPLPNATRETLVALFGHLGLPDADANKLTDALLYWMRDGYVPATSAIDDSAYAAAVTPYDPPHRSLRSFEELRSVLVARDYFFDSDDQPKPLYQAFVNSVSLYAFTAANINASQSSTLAAAALDDSQAGKVADYVAGKGDRPVGAPPYLRSAKDIRNVLGNANTTGLGTTIKCLRIKLTVREGASNMVLNALVAQPGQANLPAAAVTGDATAQQNQAPVAAADTTVGQSKAANTTTKAQTTTSLNYPFVILELSEETSSQPPALSNANS
jgi:general secretion pathway protein K